MKVFIRANSFVHVYAASCANPYSPKKAFISNILHLAVAKSIKTLPHIILCVTHTFFYPFFSSRMPNETNLPSYFEQSFNPIFFQPHLITLGVLRRNYLSSSVPFSSGQLLLLLWSLKLSLRV